MREGQVAIFAHNGKTVDVFGPGRHTLHTYNIPVMGCLIGVAFGGRSPFRAEVYFVSTRLFADLKWGTTQPILVRDPQLAGVRLRAFGMYAMQVGDVGRLIERLVAARGLYTTGDIEGYLRSIICNIYPTFWLSLCCASVCPRLIWRRNTMSCRR